MRLVHLGIVLALMVASPAHGQYVFMDANGDGVATAADQVSADGTGGADIWLDTDKNSDGSSAAASRGGESATFFSYEFVIRAVGGEVEWIGYDNAMKGFEFEFPRFASSTEFYAGYGGVTALVPGRYMLGTLRYRVKSGAPSLTFADQSPLGPGLRTAFGSGVRGKDGDHTLKYMQALDGRSGLGDWSGASGLRAGVDMSGARQPDGEHSGYRFGVTLSPNPTNPNSTVWVELSRPGPVRIRVFDVHGRAVGTLLDARDLTAGRHPVAFPSRGTGRRALSSGVYFIRVTTNEGERILRTVVLK